MTQEQEDDLIPEAEDIEKGEAADVEMTTQSKSPAQTLSNSTEVVKLKKETNFITNWKLSLNRKSFANYLVLL